MLFFNLDEDKVSKKKFLDKKIKILNASNSFYNEMNETIILSKIIDIETEKLSINIKKKKNNKKYN